MKIYHNPRCSKSRQTLALLEEKGIKPEIKLYLEEGLSKDEIIDLRDNLSLSSVREIIRKNEAEYKDNNLADKNLSEDELTYAISSNPKLLQRPIIINGNKAAIGRPPENILDII